MKHQGRARCPLLLRVGSIGPALVVAIAACLALCPRLVGQEEERGAPDQRHGDESLRRLVISIEPPDARTGASVRFLWQDKEYGSAPDLVARMSKWMSGAYGMRGKQKDVSVLVYVPKELPRDVRRNPMRSLMAAFLQEGITKVYIQDGLPSDQPLQPQGRVQDTLRHCASLATFHLDSARGAPVVKRVPGSRDARMSHSVRRAALLKVMPDASMRLVGTAIASKSFADCDCVVLQLQEDESRRIVVARPPLRKKTSRAGRGTGGLADGALQLRFLCVREATDHILRVECNGRCMGSLAELKRRAAMALLEQGAARARRGLQLRIDCDPAVTARQVLRWCSQLADWQGDPAALLVNRRVARGR